MLNREQQRAVDQMYMTKCVQYFIIDIACIIISIVLLQNDNAIISAMSGILLIITISNLIFSNYVVNTDINVIINKDISYPNLENLSKYIDIINVIQYICLCALLISKLYLQTK
jgi:hypothetical protein